VEGNEEIQIGIIHQLAYSHKCNVTLMLLTQCLIWHEEQGEDAATWTT